MTIKAASTVNTLQGVTTDPGLIFHWKFPRFFSEELRWLATYVALSRPPSLAQLISVGLPDELRNIIEGGPPEGILSRFNDMFKEKEEATHLKAAEVMRELGWDATDLIELLQSILFYRPSTRPQCTAPEHAYPARAMPLALLRL